MGDPTESTQAELAAACQRQCNKIADILNHLGDIYENLADYGEQGASEMSACYHLLCNAYRELGELYG